MPGVRQRAPVIYVAGSARELPADVQDWLGRADIRAVASPHIYDMLAQLARGKKFAAIIVNIQSVDWTEMEFFEHAARLSGHAPIYVAGTRQYRAKLEAACRHGARLFDALALEEDSSPDIEPLGMPGAAGLAGFVEPPTVSQPPETPDTSESESPRSMAVEPFGGPASRTPSSEECGSLLPQPQIPGSWPRVRLAGDFDQRPPHRDETREPDDIETGFIDEQPGDVSEQAATAEAPLNQGEPTADRIVEAPPVTPEPSVGCAPPSPPEEENEPEPGLEQPQSPETGVGPADDADDPATDRPTVRLVAVDEPVDSEPPVMFPWSANPNRPKRTPPQSGEQSGSPPSPPSGASSSESSNPSESPFKSVRLTAEEIAALMGQPPRRNAPEAQP